MMEKDENIINDMEYTPVFLEEDANNLKRLQAQFIKSYIKNKDNIEVEDWLKHELESNLPNKSEIEIIEMSKEIVETIKVNEDNKKSLQKSINEGRSKESWFASNIKQSTSHLTTAQSATYLHMLDDAIKTSNQEMYNIIITKSGSINRNFNLDGFMAEQHHVNSFNLQSKVKGNDYTAEVLVPKAGQNYGKNSVDIVIKDKNGKIVQKYQSKYGKTAKDTIKIIEDGNYNNQRLLVPAEQVEEIQKKFPNKTVEATIAKDSIKSKPLTKDKAKELQNEAQGGNWNELNWNEYKNKELAIGIGKQAGYAAVQGAAIGVGIELATKVWSGEEIRGEELVEQALVSGADFGIKAATAGALKVGVEKDIIKIIPKGTPASWVANIAYIGIENIKILREVVKGELTINQSLDKMEQTTVSTVFGIATAAKGTSIGAAVGTVLGPIGSVVGGFVGGTVGYIAGSKVGETIVKAAGEVRIKSREIVKEVGSKISSGINIAYDSIKNLATGLFSW